MSLLANLILKEGMKISGITHNVAANAILDVWISKSSLVALRTSKYDNACRKLLTRVWGILQGRPRSARSVALSLRHVQLPHDHQCREVQHGAYRVPRLPEC